MRTLVAVTRRRPRLGYAFVVAGGLLFVVNAGASRVVLRAGVDPTALTSARVTGAGVVFVLVAAAIRPAVLRPPRGQSLLLIVALGLVGVAALQWTYFVAIDRLPLGIALLLEYTAPVLVALWARFVQHEAVGNRMWLAIALSLGGLAVVGQVWQGLTLDGVGVLAALGAAVAFAAYFLLGERGVNSADPLHVVVWAFVVGAVALNVAAPVSGLDGSVLRSSTSLQGALVDLSLPVWVALCWVVVLGTVVPFMLELLALQHLPATVVTVVAMLEPVGAAAIGWSWFGEGLTLVQVAGGGAVIVAILLAQSARGAVRAEPPVPVG